MGLLHLRKISSEESRYHAFHCVFEMKDRVLFFFDIL